MATREQKTCEACGFGGSVTVETRGGKTLCEACQERRERIATAVLVAIVNASESSAPVHGFLYGRPEAAKEAIAYADALIAALDERPEPAFSLTTGDPEAPPIADVICPRACAERGCTETCAHRATHVGTQHLCHDHLPF
jgi:hypothetical protein